MPCERVRLPGNNVAIVCTGRSGRRHDWKKCGWCQEWATKLCDEPILKSVSQLPGGRNRWRNRSKVADRCSAPICDEHAHRRGKGTADYCPNHP